MEFMKRTRRTPRLKTTIRGTLKVKSYAGIEPTILKTMGNLMSLNTSELLGRNLLTYTTVQMGMLH